MEELRTCPNVELIWASPRELLNLFQAECNRVSHHHDDKRPHQEAGSVGKDLWSTRWKRSICSMKTVSKRGTALGSTEAAPRSADLRARAIILRTLV